MNENKENNKLEKDVNLENEIPKEISEELNEKDSSLEEMFKKASEEQSQYTGSPDKSKKRNIIIASSVTALALASIIGIGAFNMNNNSEFENKTKEPGWISNLEKKEKDSAYLQEWDFDYPIKIESWAKGEFSRYFFEKEKEVLEYTKKIEGLQTALVQISSKDTIIHTKDGKTSNEYTSDLNERFLENGKENPYYRHALKEDYEMAFAVITQRLINPLFGKWVFAQKADFSLKDNTQYESLKDIFDETWWNNNVSKSDYSSLPILVDWTGSEWNDIGLADRIDGQYGTFYGVIDESPERKIISKSTGIDELGERIIKFEVPITYYAFRQNGGNVEKKGTLHFSLKSTENSQYQELKLVATDAKLVLED